MTDAIQNSSRLTELTADIVSSYVASNTVAKADISGLISMVHAALDQLGRPAPQVEKPVPAVPVKKSITPDFLISLEDGRQYKSLKRHLAGRGLTPAEYRTKWDLPPTYPMVAPNYAKQRSELAKALGLGRKPAPAPAAPARKAKAAAAKVAAGAQTKRAPARRKTPA